ncbi:MAG: gliding motility-associated C-terminal domain-containing protein, partial [Panacibacter sp.]
SFTHNGGSTDLRLVKTDVNGNADCIQTPLTITTSDVTPAFQVLDSAMRTDQTPGTWYAVAAIGTDDYRIYPEIVCRKTCCTDVTDTANKIDLCNAVSYTLPNNDIVKNTGTYNIVYKTSKGCDSIVYYNVTFSTNPVVGLGPDACLDGKDSVILKTAPGYNTYSWIGSATTGSEYIVRKPGIYTVAVTNACGTTKDTIQVFQQCEFSIFMPNAFTPNGDNLNDVFRIPKGVSNRLLSFKIFNRWGQVIFSTANINQGWNGNLQEYQAPTGTYAYYIVMESIDGKKKLTQKGLVTLLR